MRDLWAKRLTGAAILAALLMHLLVGCCGHHAHAACETEQALASAHHSHDDSPGKNAPDGPKHRPGCDVVRCVFVASADNGLAKLSGGTPSAVLVKLASSIDPAAHPREVAPTGKWGDGGPVRLHLLKRVLLV